MGDVAKSCDWSNLNEPGYGGEQAEAYASFDDAPAAYRLLQPPQHFGKVVTQRRLRCRSGSIRMDNGNLRDQILHLEAEIGELTEVMESCRKVILVSKIAIAAGAIWLLAFMFGAIRFDAIAMIGAISAVIGGTVVLGSNTSTSKQATAAIKAAEARRTELIGKIELRLIGEAEG